MTPDDLWQFSLLQYANQQESLLDWQNRCGANVNFALACQYLDKVGLSLTEGQINTLHNFSVDFERQFTAPLRQLRSQYKSQQSQFELYPKIRQLLLDAELEVEKQQQHDLVHEINQLPLSSLSNPKNWLSYQRFLSSKN